MTEGTIKATAGMYFRDVAEEGTPASCLAEPAKSIGSWAQRPAGQVILPDIGDEQQEQY